MVNVITCPRNNWLSRLGPQDVMPEEPDKLRHSIPHSLVQRHIEDTVQLLQGLALCFGQEQQHEDEPYHIPSCVPTESTLGCEGRLQGRPGHRKNEVEEPGCGGSNTHAHGADVQRVRFSRIGEWDWPLTRRVYHAKEVDA